MQSLTTRLAMFLAVMLAGSAILLTAFMYVSTRSDVLATLQREVNAVTEQQNNNIATWLAAKKRVIEANAPLVLEARGGRRRWNAAGWQ
jgi:hypothetical protein